MKSFIVRIAALFALPIGFLVTSGSSSSCGAQFADALLDSNGYSYGGDGESRTTTSDLNDKLLVDGSGDTINLDYNELVFPALLNKDSGLYYFAPDPEGAFTGDKIICNASINENDVQGDCFRQGHVCHFDYWSEGTTTSDGKDVYYLGTTTCRRGGDVGPFLVPLDSPVCGQDPYPACPSNDLFPTGPDEGTTTGGTTGGDTGGTETQPAEPESQPAA